MRKEIKSHWHTWIFLLTLGLILIIVYKALDSIGYLGDFIANFISVISPFLAGLLLAYLLYIPQHKIEKIYKRSKKKFFRKSARSWSILTTYVIMILILIIIINFILPVIIESVNELISNLQLYYSKIIETYNNLPNDSIFKTEKLYTALKEFQNFDLKQYINIDSITKYVKSVVGLAKGVFDVFVAIIVSIYILAERDQILSFLNKFLKAVLKPKHYDNIKRYFYNSNGVFFKFISSQFLDAIVVGVLTTIAMKIIKVKYASLLGFTIGLFNMIPYFGAIFAVALSALVTLITSGYSKFY